MATINAINSNIPIEISKGGTAATSLTNHAVLLGQNTSAITGITLTDGQLVVGSTAADPVAASLTAGTNITVTPGAGTLSIASTPESLTWNDVTLAAGNLVAGNGYVADNAGLVTLTLPATCAFGKCIAVAGGVTGATGWLIAQNAGQQIHFASLSTTLGVGGSLASTLQYDSVELVCVVTDTTFVVRSSVGNITVV